MSIISLYQAHPCNSCNMLAVCAKDRQFSKSGVTDRSHRVFQRKHALIDSGDHFAGIYVLHSGSAKAFVTAQDGTEQITAFYFPGDIIGLDGFDNQMHVQSVRFLETSSVCFFSAKEIKSLMQNSEGALSGLLKAMSHALTEDNAMLLALSNSDSEQRVAKFLLDLSKRYKARGCSDKEFILSMTRTDIANYLGMAIETVSRIFTKLQKNGIISVAHRRLEILDPIWLKACLQTSLTERLTGTMSS